MTSQESFFHMVFHNVLRRRVLVFGMCVVDIGSEAIDGVCIGLEMICVPVVWRRGRVCCRGVLAVGSCRSDLRFGGHTST